jgi:hippurate hydrolase
MKEFITMSEENVTGVLANLTATLPELETLYKDIHAHPELSMQETRTAGIAADHLRASGFEVTTGVGKTVKRGLLASCTTETAQP